jgi:hypothetical protein
MMRGRHFDDPIKAPGEGSTQTLENRPGCHYVAAYVPTGACIVNWASFTTMSVKTCWVEGTCKIVFVSS